MSRPQFSSPGSLLEIKATRCRRFSVTPLRCTRALDLDPDAAAGDVVVPTSRDRHDAAIVLDADRDIQLSSEIGQQRLRHDLVAASACLQRYPISQKVKTNPATPIPSPPAKKPVPAAKPAAARPAGPRRGR